MAIQKKCKSSEWNSHMVNKENYKIDCKHGFKDGI